MNNIFKNISFGKKGFKYFIGYKDDQNIMLLCILLTEMSGYVKSFDESKCMFFLIKDEEFLEKHNICDKVSSSIS